MTPSPIQDGQLVLVLNAAEDVPQMLLGRRTGPAGEIIAYREFSADEPVMEVLLPGLQDMLTASGHGLADIAGIACVRGPGRFTGLRIVLATALGLARATRAELAGLDYLPVLAATAWARSGPRLAVAVKARSGLVFSQFFAKTSAPGSFTPQTPAEVLPIKVFIQRLGAIPGSPITLLGSGLELCEPHLAETRHDYVLLPEEYNRPSAEALLQHALTAEFSQQPIEPLYLRVSEAEENLASIALSRGLAPEQAKARLDQLRR